MNAPDTHFARQLATGLTRLDGEPRARGLHAVVVLRDGVRVAEHFVPGEDERWGEPLGRREFGPDSLHDVRSVTKSIVSLLYGIALSRGEVPPPEAALLDGLPPGVAAAADRAHHSLRVEDVLSMRLGIEWEEGLDYSDPRNCEVAMERAADRVGFVLAQPRVAPPGERWQYCGGATALLAALLAHGTGCELSHLAREWLFKPLGIGTEWVRGADGQPVPASGLRMRAGDLARLGQLVLDGGRDQIPADWLDAALQPHAIVDDDLAYGYQWWVARRWNWVAAFGNGGQRMMILPRARLVLVVFAGRYNDPQAWQVPVHVLTEVVLPALDAAG